MRVVLAIMCMSVTVIYDSNIVIAADAEYSYKLQLKRCADAFRDGNKLNIYTVSANGECVLRHGNGGKLIAEIVRFENEGVPNDHTLRQEWGVDKENKPKKREIEPRTVYFPTQPDPYTYLWVPSEALRAPESVTIPCEYETQNKRMKMTWFCRREDQEGIVKLSGPVASEDKVLNVHGVGYMTRVLKDGIVQESRAEGAFLVKKEQFDGLDDNQKWVKAIIENASEVLVTWEQVITLVPEKNNGVK